MKTSTSFALAFVALAFTAACSSSEGDGTGGGAPGTGGGTTTGDAGGGTTTGDAGGGNSGGGDVGGGGNCGETPLDCIDGDYVEDKAGCTTCQYWQCAVDVCGPDAEFEACVGFGVTICDPGDDDCGALDSHGNGMICPNGFVCADDEWGCACPSQRPEPGAACGEVGQLCDVPSDLDCGPAFLRIECTDEGWADAPTDGGTGGSDCG